MSACDCKACRESRDAAARDNEGCTCPFAGWNPRCPAHGYDRESMLSSPT